MPAKPFTFEFEFDWDKDPLAKQPSRPLKYLPPAGGVVEITTRTIHGRFLLKPSTRANEIIRGVLGRALWLFPEVRLFGFFFLSNHYNLLAFFPDVFTMAGFMDHVNGCLGRELGRLYDWHERLFGRRYRGIVLADDRAQVSRLAYLLAQGTKENLVARPDQWPGVSSLKASLAGERITGRWLDRTALYRSRQRDAGVREKDFFVTYDIPVHPLPCWQALEDDERRRRVGSIVAAIEDKARQVNAGLRRKPLGVDKVLSQNPHDRPGRIAKSPAPMCHASSRRSFWKFADAYRARVAAYRVASRAYRAGDLDAAENFPPGCFMPGIGSRRASPIAA